MLIENAYFFWICKIQRHRSAIVLLLIIYAVLTPVQVVGQLRDSGRIDPRRKPPVNELLNDRHEDKQSASLQIQVGTAKNKQVIESSACESRLQEIAIQHDRIARNMRFAVIGLILLSAVLGYSFFTSKQRANRDRSAQQEQIKTQDNALIQLVTEREWLLKEIHHRVKNNLQIVISLLNSQSVYLKDPGMRSVFRESQNRMRAISLIHQKLYQGDNLSGIDMYSYTHELAEHLQDSFDTGGRISVFLEVEKITMDVSQAVPIGLILNEAITNSIKYAFQEMETGRIHVVLKKTEAQQMLLSIADNGSGLPEGFDLDSLDALGMKLMKGLSRQIGATFELQPGQGLYIQISGKLIDVLSNPHSGHP